MTYTTPRTWETDDLIDESMLNTQVRDNIAHLGGMKFANVTLSALASGVSAARVATGAYTGNGGATKAITGLGFQPKFVLIYPKASATVYAGWKSDQDSTYAFLQADSNSRDQYATDHIISLDSDGFTVGDGTGLFNHLNANAVNYAFCAWG